MNYRHPELRARLAAEYVLGTLHGRARRRFERLLTQDAALRAEVDRWQRELGPLAEAVTAITPPARTWSTITTRLGWRRAPWWRRGDLWGSFALGSAFAAGVLLAVALYFGLGPSAPERYLAVVNDTSGQPAWVLRATDTDTPIEVHAIAPRPLTADKAYELWYVPGDNRPPQSLGLIPATGTAKLEVPNRLRAALANQAIVAVSLEPAGGSPTGAPTGPVLYQGRWVPLKQGVS